MHTSGSMHNHFCATKNSPPGQTNIVGFRKSAVQDLGTFQSPGLETPGLADPDGGQKSGNRTPVKVLA